MDLLFEGILIAIMMAIILFFVVYEASVFFTPNSSISDYNTFVGMTSSACTSTQTTSNLQFSSPQIFVFQFYDSNACNLALGSNTNIFSPTSSVLSSLVGNYVMCYANVSNPAALGLSSGDQYYLKQSTADNINFYLSNKDVISGSGNMSAIALYNQLLENGVDINSSSAFSLTITAPKLVNPSNYTFDVQNFVNTTSDITFYFNGLSTCSLSYTDVSNLNKLILVPPCQRNITNITIQVTPLVKGAFYYQTNISAVPNQSPSQKYLSQQCTKLPSLVSEGTIGNSSIVCRPITCGGTSFMLADQNNRPFFGMYGGSYTFFGVQSGINDLQIVNSHSEQLLNSSLTSQTVFEEKGVPLTATWSVVYDGETKSSFISVSGTGNSIDNIITFSVPPGNYSFKISANVGTPNVSKGYAVQGAVIPINFSLN